jgi:stage II sporulation protein D
MFRFNCKLKKNRLYAAALMIPLILSFAGTVSAVENFTVKIGVDMGVASGNLLGRGLSLRDAKGAKGSAADGALAAYDGSALTVGGKKYVLPLTVKASGGVGWKETRYRGSLAIIKTPGAQGKFTVVNEVELEDYLRGILKIEMNPDWHQEALKAQSILARTYAAKNRGRFADRGFDLDNSQNSQIYRGMNAEDPRTDAAVKATRGQVLTWNGKPADVYYHSDSGGATADISHVWGSSSPYLRSQAEKIAYASPYSNWQTSFSAAQVALALQKIGKSVGNVTGVEVAMKDANGRAVTLRVRGDKGTADVSAHAFRMAVGSSVLRSTNFEITGAEPGISPAIAPAPAPVQTPARAQISGPSSPRSQKVLSLAEIAAQKDPLMELTNNDIFTKDELIDMLMNPEKRDSYLKIGLERLSGMGPQQKPANPTPANPPVPTPRAPAKPSSQANSVKAAGTFTFKGKGWGHGVGMSQWGAKAMADSGAKAADILLHYFPGTKIGK